MMCPFCKADDDRVVDTRPAEEGQVVRRRRECNVCHRRFTSNERVEEIQLYVVKRNGKKEPFDREKIVKSIQVACRKLNKVDRDQIADIAGRVEMRCHKEQSKEVAAEKVGAWVSEELKKLDPVAFVRFSSVYLAYQDVHQFIEVISSLEKEA